MRLTRRIERAVAAIAGRPMGACPGRGAIVRKVVDPPAADRDAAGRCPGCGGSHTLVIRRVVVRVPG